MMSPAAMPWITTSPHAGVQVSLLVVVLPVLVPTVISRYGSGLPLAGQVSQLVLELASILAEVATMSHLVVVSSLHVPVVHFW